MEQTLSIAEIQREIDHLPEQFEPIVATQYEKPVLVILPFDTFQTINETIQAQKAAIDALQEKIEGLLETLEIMKDDEAMAALSQSLEDIKAGRLISWEDVQKELGWE
jgi:hypothetical protein